MKGKNILVACSALDYILIQKLLSDSFLLDKAGSREDIVNRIEKNKYDLFLIDIAFLRPDFKVIDGVVKENLPVIALSSEPNDARDKAIKKSGCCACYVKPIRSELFKAFVSYWMDEYGKN